MSIQPSTATIAAGVGLILICGSSVFGQVAAPVTPDAQMPQAQIDRLHLETPVKPGPAAQRPQTPRATSSRTVWELNGFKSVQVNVDAAGNNIFGDAANEPSIATDPTAPSTFVIGWRQFDTVMNNFRQAGMAFSHDDGQSWTNPGVLEPGVFSSDPVLDYDADGRIYYYALQPDRGPGNWACYMYGTDDGGVTWPLEVYAYGGDKAWMAIDRTDGIGRGNIYVPWSSNSSAGCCFPSTFTRSTDRGLTWMQPRAFPVQMFSHTVAVGPDGELYVFGSTFGFPAPFNLIKYTNAKDPAQVPTIDFITGVNLDGSRAMGGINPDGLLGQAWVATDHSNGSTQGNVYVLSTVFRASVSDPADVMFARSTDGGLTWTDPVRVNDDPTGNSAWQWFGTMSVAPNGRIDVIFNDTRNEPTASFSELYYTSSSDGGDTWMPNIPVSLPFNHSLGWPDQAKLGDYYDMISDLTGASVAYAATFNGEQDVYYLRIEAADCNGNGFPDYEDVAMERSEDCDGDLIPDECARDCDDDGEPDTCEVLAGATDCDENMIPDACQGDFDGDLLIDACDPDIDNDGVPNGIDECDFSPPGLPIDSDGDVRGNRNSTCALDLEDFAALVDCVEQSFGPLYEAYRHCATDYDYNDDYFVDLHDTATFINYLGIQVRGVGGAAPASDGR